MPSPAFTQEELLEAVGEKCRTASIHARLGRSRCHRATVWRALLRAEQQGLVRRSEAGRCDVWELKRKRRRSPFPARPRCPTCSTRAGTRLDRNDAAIEGLRCRWCGETWPGTPGELRQAARADRTMITVDLTALGSSGGEERVKGAKITGATEITRIEFRYLPDTEQPAGKFMGFSMTTAQIRRQEKTVTRRLRWLKAKPGDRIQAVEKAMGLRKGEQKIRLANLEIVSVRRERLDAITQEDVAAEGFPDWTPEDFIRFFCKGAGR